MPPNLPTVLEFLFLFLFLFMIELIFINYQSARWKSWSTEQAGGGPRGQIQFL